MLESEGILFHIDFGYLLARTIKFEKAPFKLTDEFIEVMGGDQSKYFKVRQTIHAPHQTFVLTTFGRIIVCYVFKVL